MTFYFEELTLVVGLLMQSGADLPHEDVICMARNIYQEARGESLKGQIAVGFVTLHRVTSADYPNSICGVVEQRSERGAQFSWVGGAEMKMPSEWAAYQAAMLIAIAVMQGNVPDPVPGATHYYAPGQASPDWAQKFAEVRVIGDHRFMKK